jgi:hypothetical protein
MVNYKQEATTLTDEALVEGIQHTRKLLKGYQQLELDLGYKHHSIAVAVDELDARLTAYMIERWYRKYPTSERT